MNEENQEEYKSRFGDRTSSECEHDWEFGQVMLGAPYTPRRCKKCGLVN